jgi:hypothetical protein
VLRVPKVVIELPTQELMLSLNERLQQFPGEKGIGVEPPQRFIVDLVDFPTDPSELEEVLAVVQEWVDDVGIESVRVEAEGKAYELRRSGG